MSRKLTASDRKSLIRLASSLPQGSSERRAILAGLLTAAWEHTGWGDEGSVDPDSWWDLQQEVVDLLASTFDVLRSVAASLAVKYDTWKPSGTRNPDGTLRHNFFRELAQAERPHELEQELKSKSFGHEDFTPKEFNDLLKIARGAMRAFNKMARLGPLDGEEVLLKMKKRWGRELQKATALAKRT